jgi:hypothetical protein
MAQQAGQAAVLGHLLLDVSLVSP